MAAVPLGVLILLASFRLGSTAGAGDPTISQDIITETKPVGATGRLNCTVGNKGFSDTVIWTRLAKEGSGQKGLSRDEDIVTMNPLLNGIEKYQVKVHSTEKDADTVIYQLIVRRLTQTDDGYYSCRVQRRGVEPDYWPSRQGLLNVQRPPKIDLAETNAIVIARAGDNATLHCAATGKPDPRIKWMRKGSHYLKDPHGNYVPKIEGKTYTIYNVQREDKGSYTCMADNNVVPPAKFDVTLKVFFKPTAEAFRRYLGQAVDRNYVVELNCRVSGYPEPELKWYQISRDHNRKPKLILNDNKHDVEVINSRGPYLAQWEAWMILRVRRLQSGDLGTYRCYAQNKVGNASAEINIFKTSTCQGSDCYNQQQIDGASGVHVTTAAFVFLILCSFNLV